MWTVSVFVHFYINVKSLTFSIVQYLSYLNSFYVETFAWRRRRLSRQTRSALRKPLALGCEHTCRFSAGDMLERSAWHLRSVYLSLSEIKRRRLSVPRAVTHSRVMAGVPERRRAQEPNRAASPQASKLCLVRRCFDALKGHLSLLAAVVWWLILQMRWRASGLLFFPVFCAGAPRLMLRCAALPCLQTPSVASSHAPWHTAWPTSPSWQVQNRVSCHFNIWILL